MQIDLDSILAAVAPAPIIIRIDGANYPLRELSLGEVVMLPGKPRLTFDKVLLFGAGPRATFSEDTFKRLVHKMLGVMEALSARVSVVELPGRPDELIPADRAADILLAFAGGRPEHDVWTLVENAEGKQRVVQHMIEERRRVRRVF